MSRHFIAESPLTSTPLRTSQGLFSHSPADSIVPNTPSFARYHYSNDQRVPLTPVTQIVRSPVNLSSVPATQVNSATTIPTEPTLLIENVDNFTACLISLDQIVPSTPKSTVNKTSRTAARCEQRAYSHHTSRVHESDSSCIGDPQLYETSVSLSNDAVTYLRQCSQKGLSANKTRNNRNFNSAMNSFTDTLAFQSPPHDADANEAFTLSTPDYSSQPLYENPGVLLEMPTLSPVAPDVPSHSRNTSSAQTLTAALISHIPHSVSVTSNVRFGASRSMNYASTGSSPNQDTVLNNSEQLKLFDGDDIFG